MTLEIVEGKYAAGDLSEFAQLIVEELGDDFSPHTFLETIQTPGAGALTFDNPFSEDPSRPEQLSDFRGTIIAERVRSVLYLASFDEREDNARPDAWSDDGIVQVVPEETIAKIDALNAADGGNRAYPLRDLASCPYNTFGGQPWLDNGKGSATKTYKELLVLIAGQELPVRLSLPRSSQKQFRDYKNWVVKTFRKQLAAIETEFSLERDKSSSDITFSKWAFKAVGQLPQAEVANLKEFGRTLLGTLQAKPQIEAPVETTQIAQPAVYTEPIVQAPAVEQVPVAAGVAAPDLDL